MSGLTYFGFLEQVIEDGLESVAEAYEPDDPRRLGASEGFEICRGLEPDALRALHLAETQATRTALLRADDARREWKSEAERLLGEYERQRYRDLQVEWCCNCVSVLLVSTGGEPLLPWQPTARGVAKVGAVFYLAGKGETKEGA